MNCIKKQSTIIVLVLLAISGFSCNKDNTTVRFQGLLNSYEWNLDGNGSHSSTDSINEEVTLEHKADKIGKPGDRILVTYTKFQFGDLSTKFVYMDYDHKDGKDIIYKSQLPNGYSILIENKSANQMSFDFVSNDLSFSFHDTFEGGQE